MPPGTSAHVSQLYSMCKGHLLLVVTVQQCHTDLLAAVCFDFGLVCLQCPLSSLYKAALLQG